MERRKSQSYIDLERINVTDFHEQQKDEQGNDTHLHVPKQPFSKVKNFKLPITRSSSFEDKVQRSPILKTVDSSDEDEDAQDFLEPEDVEQNEQIPLHVSPLIVKYNHDEHEEQHSLFSSTTSSASSASQLPSFMLYSPRIDHFPTGIANIPLTSPRVQPQQQHSQQFFSAFSNYPNSTQNSTPSSPTSTESTAKQHVLQIRKRGFLYQLTSFHQQQQTSPRNHPRTQSFIGSPSNYYWNSLSTTKKTVTTEPKISPTTTQHSLNNNLLPQSSPWTKKYVALTQDTIYLFKSPQDKKAYGFIECASIYRIEPMQSNTTTTTQQQQSNLYTYKKRNFCFSIRTYARSYMFSCETEQEMKEWIRELERSMADCISESMTHSFRHLLNSHHDDSQLFLSTIFEKMALVNTKWSMNRKEFLQDLEQFVTSQQQTLGSNTPRMTSPLSFSKFEIDYKELVIEKKIAEGAFGEVFSGKLWGKRVAIKRLKLNYRSQQQSKEDWDHIIDKLQQEAQIMSELHHPNVLLLIAVCTQLPNICLVSEFVEQGNLYDYLSHHFATDWSLFCKMVKDIICGMAYLHNRNVLHLDLKPLNILVQNGTIKIADFGISKFLRRKDETLQQAFSGYGTLLYLSDEILYHNTYSIKSDVFSFGILLYELLYMREHPDCNFTERDSVGFNLIREPLSKRQKPNIPPWWNRTLGQLITQCVDTDPQQRPTFDQILTQLYESPLSPLLVKEDEEWFLMRQHSKQLLRLSKQCQTQPVLQQQLVEFQFWQVLQYMLSIAKDKQVIVNCLCSMTQFAVNMPLSISVLDTFMMVIQRWEQEVLQDDGNSIQNSISHVSNVFSYFAILLQHPQLDSSNKYRILHIIQVLLQHSSIVLRFVQQQLTKTLLFVYSQYKIELGYIICSILSQSITCLAQENQLALLQIVEKEGGIETLIQFAKPSTVSSHNTSIMVIALHALAQLSQIPHMAAQLMQQYQFKPILLAMRAFAPPQQPMNSLKSINNGTSTSTSPMNGIQHTAFEKSHLRREGEKVLPLMRLSFSKAKERFEHSISKPVQSDILHPMSQKYSSFVVQELWSQLIKNMSHLETISTQELKQQLLSQYESQRIVEKKQLESQIDLLVGQMDSPTALTSYLYLGSEWNASKLQELQSLQISVIINVSHESPNYFTSQFTYHHIPAQTDLIQVIDQVFAFILDAKKQGKKVLLHSLFGVSRAAALCMGYLMFHRNYSLQKAFKYVKDLRPIIHPSRDYMRQLMNYEMTLQGTSTLGVKIEVTSATDSSSSSFDEEKWEQQSNSPTIVQYVNTPLDTRTSF